MKKTDGTSLRERTKASYRTRRWRVGSYSVAAVVIVAAIAVALNLIVGALPGSAAELDMTPQQLYTLSGESEQTLAALDRDVEIYWIVQSGSEDATLEELLGRYAEYSHVSVTRVDPVKYPNFLSAYTDESAANNSLVVVCGERSMYIPYTDIWTYSDYEQYAYYYYNYGQEYRDTFAGEQKITSAVGYVTSEELPVMYVLSGHGEAALSETVRSAVALQNVQVEDLSLLTVEAVPDDCGILCINGPVSDLSAAETAMIREYLERGGRLLAATAYTQEDMTNFDGLLADWGLSVRYGYVLEDNSRYHFAGYVDLLLPEMQSHNITSPLSEAGYSVLFPDAQALVMGSTAEDVTLSSLLKSSSESYLKTELAGTANLEKADGDEEGPFVLAAAAVNKTTGGQIVVFGSNSFMERDFSDMVSGANLDMYLNAVDWLCEKTEAISIHAKTISTDYLTFSDSAAGAARVVLLALVPLAFAAVGLVTFIRRRRR